MDKGKSNAIMDRPQTTLGLRNIQAKNTSCKPAQNTQFEVKKVPAVFNDENFEDPLTSR